MRIVITLFVWSVVASAVAFAGMNDCVHCGASTHTSSYCNRRPEGSINPKGMVLKNGRWVSPGKSPLSGRANRDDAEKKAPNNIPISPVPEQASSPASNRDNSRLAAEQQRSLQSNQTSQRLLHQFKATDQALAESKEQLAESIKQNDDLKAQILNLEKQVETLKQQSAYYEKYARTLRNQLGLKPEDFKSFQPNE